MKVFQIIRAVAGEIPTTYAGGSKSAPAPIPTPPPVAPPPEEQATLETVDTTVEERKAQTLGAKSLQIPLGTIGGDKPLNI